METWKATDIHFIHCNSLHCCHHMHLSFEVLGSNGIDTCKRKNNYYVLVSAGPHQFVVNVIWNQHSLIKLFCCYTICHYIHWQKSCEERQRLM